MKVSITCAALTINRRQANIMNRSAVTWIVRSVGYEYWEKT